MDLDDEGQKFDDPQAIKLRALIRSISVLVEIVLLTSGSADGMRCTSDSAANTNSFPCRPPGAGTR